MSRRAVAVVAIALVGAASAERASHAQPGATTSSAQGSASSEQAPSATEGPSRTVSGVLVTLEGKLAASQIVRAGAAQATTDADGRFTLSGVPPTYDLLVLDPSGAHVSVYLGLRRRDLRLMAPAASVYGPQPGLHKARVHGTLAGGGTYPLDEDRVVIHLSAGPIEMTSWLGKNGAIGGRGPDYELTNVFWDGPDTIEGDLFAMRYVLPPPSASSSSTGGSLATSTPASGPPSTGRPVPTSTWFAHRHVTIHDGDQIEASLTLASLPRIHVDERVQMPMRTWPTQVGVQYDMATPSFARFVGVGGGGATNPRGTSFGFDIPDLRPFGTTLCATSSYGSLGLWIWTSKCHVSPDAPVSLTLPRPPPLTSPSRGSDLDESTSFTWGPVSPAGSTPSTSPPTAADGIYVLRLVGAVATPSDPEIDVFTTRTSIAWADLKALGTPLPVGSATYHVSVAARGPARTMDEAFGPHGIAAPVRSEAFVSRSREVDFRVLPPPSPPNTAACSYPRGSAIRCPGQAYFVLSAMNDKLRHFPQLAAATGIRCVSDCASAAAFMKAYTDYAKAHPGFEANEPTDW